MSTKVWNEPGITHSPESWWQPSGQLDYSSFKVTYPFICFVRLYFNYFPAKNFRDIYDVID